MFKESGRYPFGSMKEALMGNMVIEQIRELGKLHADGILTDEEFAAKKAELLARL